MELTLMENSPNTRTRTVAVVSGKGGTGKTMIVAAMAHVLAAAGYSVLIVDADTGTAGMTYYLGLTLVANTRVGLSNVLPARKEPRSKAPLIEELTKCIQPLKSIDSIRFLGIGDHRRLEKEVSEKTLPEGLARVILTLQQSNMAEWIIIDCRGGIDRESLAVCAQVDDVILITESDTTSFQATKHVVDVLSDNELAHKARGFIVNKVFDDPRVIVSQGTGVFGTQFLSAIPFDLAATRSFLIGNVPSITSPFGRHIWAGLHRAYPDDVSPSPIPAWDFDEYREIGLTNLDSLRGGGAAAAFIMTMGAVVVFRWSQAPTSFFELIQRDRVMAILIIGTVVMGLIGSIEITRRALGRIISIYVRALGRLFLKERSTG
jgi:septum site-determining protein MinD